MWNMAEKRGERRTARAHRSDVKSGVKCLLANIYIIDKTEQVRTGRVWNLERERYIKLGI